MWYTWYSECRSLKKLKSRGTEAPVNSIEAYIVVECFNGARNKISRFMSKIPVAVSDVNEWHHWITNEQQADYFHAGCYAESVRQAEKLSTNIKGIGTTHCSQHSQQTHK
ncbi:hypothetical protein CBL_13580 [Carabus blaptoides fortunei]